MFYDQLVAGHCSVSLHTCGDTGHRIPTALRNGNQPSDRLEALSSKELHCASDVDLIATHLPPDADVHNHSAGEAEVRFGREALKQLLKVVILKADIRVEQTNVAVIAGSESLETRFSVLDHSSKIGVGTWREADQLNPREFSGRCRDHFIRAVGGAVTYNDPL
jgi:hypothetical protein